MCLFVCLSFVPSADVLGRVQPTKGRDRSQAKPGKSPMASSRLSSHRLREWLRQGGSALCSSLVVARHTCGPTPETVSLFFVDFTYTVHFCYCDKIFVGP